MIEKVVYPTTVIYVLTAPLTYANISADVISPISVEYGMMNTELTTRVASTGKMTFSLRNDADCIGGLAGYYTPLGANCPAWWTIGANVLITISEGGSGWPKFRGYVAKIAPTSDIYGTRAVDVTVYDWMNFAALYSIEGPDIAYDKKIEEIVPLVITDMPIQPYQTDYGNGVSVFPTVFDTTTTTTKALSEFNKLALSEMGYIYMVRDSAYGDTLKVEGRFDRNSRNTLKTWVVPTEYSEYILTELGDFFTTELGELIVLDEVGSATFTNTMMNTDTSFGENIINEVTVSVYPRRVDTSPAVLYSLSSPIRLAPDEVKSGVRGSFRDANNLATKVTGFDMIAPVGGIAWLCYQNSDGTGADLTSDFDITAVYTANDVTYEITNNSTLTGYVTKLEASGYGIYIYAPTQVTEEDATSKAAYGTSPVNIQMKYQDDVEMAQVFAEHVLADTKDLKRIVNSVEFLANTDPHLLHGFLNIEIGDLIYLTDTEMEIAGYYYINSIKYEISQGGIIMFEWGVKEAKELDDDYWFLGDVGYSELDSTTELGY